MELPAAVTATSLAVDGVATVSVDHCDVSMLRAELRRLKTTQSRLDAQVARLTHAADAAGAFIGTGARDTAEWLGTETGTSTRRNRGAAELGKAMADSDELTDAVTSGSVSTDQAAAAVGAIKRWLDESAIPLAKRLAEHEQTLADLRIHARDYDEAHRRHDRR